MNPPKGDRAEREPAPRALPSKSLALVCALHAVPLGWASLTLPWQTGSWFTIVLGGLALFHITVAALALARRERPLKIAWRVLAIVSLLVLLGLTAAIVGSALYLSELYRGIGRAISAALFGIWGLFVLFTIPVSVWGLSRTGWPPGSRARRLRGLALLVLILALAMLWTKESGRAAIVRTAEPEIVERALGAPLRALSAENSPESSLHPVSLFHPSAGTCQQTIDRDRLTLLVTYVDRGGRPVPACLQAGDPQTLARALGLLLETRAARGHAVKLDLVRAVDPLRRSHPLLDALKIRPARDGVCSKNRCFAPWQLVALDAFTQYRPLDAVRDARFGCSFDELARMLGSKTPEQEPLLRIETHSLLHQGKNLVRLRPLGTEAIAAPAGALENAVRRAERHIVAAEREDGSFRYLLDPFRGTVDPGDAVSLPRQAGTVFALCELGRERKSRSVAHRALSQLASFERQRDQISALSSSPVRAQLGPSALPLVAFAACRSWVGDQHDPLIGRLARLLLAMQREDGSFAPEFLLSRKAQRGTHTPLYATGQAVLALVLVGQLASASPSGPFPAPADLGSALRRAMDYYSKDYWPPMLRSLFFLEENWHCLAARAALSSHRHDAYERFCLDYVSFKARLILEPSDGADPEHVGGYSLSNMLPPHSTASAGFAEALAAAISIKQARGMEVAEDRERMQRVLGFVLRQQWTQQTCFACADREQVIGGFSESSASPAIRIDYVQHAMAALGHGLSALGPLAGHE